MGLFDRVVIEDGLDEPLPGFDGDETAVTWQSKSLGRPAMETYKITMDGRLFREQTRTETVPEAERPRYDEELGGFKDEFDRCLGMLRTIHEGWTDTEYHGVFEFHRHVDGEGYAYEATFTHGDLEGFKRVQRWTTTLDGD